MTRHSLFLLASLLFALVPAWGAGQTESGSAADPLTRENWVGKTAFAVDPSLAPFEPGARITEKNLSEIREKIAPCVQTLLARYNLGLTLREYEPVIPSDGYIRATNEHAADVRLVDTGTSYRKKGLAGYVSGLPFPKPRTGIEEAWNYQYAYTGDDGAVDFGVYWVSPHRGVELWEQWIWKYILRVMHRTDLPPLPQLPGLAAKGIQSTRLTETHFPRNKRGFVALYFRSEAPKDSEVYVYVPQIEKEARFLIGTRGDSWDGTDLLHEDIRGYAGHPEWMSWRMLSRGTYLAPMHAGVPYGKENAASTFDFETWPHWNPRMQWEPRPLYVVEAVPKMQTYPYGRMVFYIDAESHCILFKEAYDRWGKLWKIFLQGYNASPDPRTLPPLFACELVVDVQNEHGTAFAVYEIQANPGLSPDLFSVQRLRSPGS